MLKHKKVGGIHFLRIGRINISVSRSKHKNPMLDSMVRDAVHRQWDRESYFTSGNALVLLLAVATAFAFLPVLGA